MKQYPFLQTRFVLVAPRMAANVGSAARAMKTMGFNQLYLVEPVTFPVDHPDAIALASGANDVLSQAKHCSDLSQALLGCTHVVALTARPREWGGVLVQLPSYTQKIAQLSACESAAQPAPTVAYVFGNERFGLSNQDISVCGAVCTIDVNPQYGSLNLAQAVQVVAYAQRMAYLDAFNSPIAASLSRELLVETPANHEQLMGLLEHSLQVLEKVGYYDPQQPRRLKERLASILSRAQLTKSDVDMLRGMNASVDKRID